MTDKSLIQVKDGKWYAAGHGPPLLEECCSCGLVHRTEYKIANGRVWVRWVVDEKETRKARKRPQEFVRAKTARQGS